jgi:exosome complex component RRP4
LPGQIFVEDRQVVCPGDLLAEGEFEIPWSPYIYKEKNRYYSTVVGLVDVKNGTFTVIPLKGSKYLPKVGDTVLGIIEEVELYGWSVDIKAPYPGYLPASALLNRPVSPGEDLRRYLDVGDYVAVKIEVYDRTTGPILTAKGSDLGKINDGSVIEVSPAKIPRVIGKNRSMINMMATMTGCHINAYPNGMIHVRCPTQVAEEVLKEAISIIERESQTKGLTERIKQFISSKLGEGNAGGSAEA